MAGLGELILVVGVKEAGLAPNIPHASFYRRKRADSASAATRPPRSAAARALAQGERGTVLACLHGRQFIVIF